MKFFLWVMSKLTLKQKAALITCFVLLFTTFVYSIHYNNASYVRGGRKYTPSYTYKKYDPCGHPGRNYATDWQLFWCAVAGD
jgi:hypothetical protein